jgi:hypothetical protein
MIRRYLLPQMSPLWTTLAPLCLIALIGVVTPTFAQVATTCSNFGSTSAGTPLRLHLNSTADPHGNCVSASSSGSLTPGAVVAGCYDGTEQTPDGFTLDVLTTCTVCQPGQAGCFTYSPPLPTPSTFPIPPGYFPPYDPYDPYDPYNPFNPYDPLSPYYIDPGSLPPDYWFPDIGPPPVMPDSPPRSTIGN